MRVVLLISILLALPARADPPPPIACSDGRHGPRHCIRPASFAADVCRQIEAEARLHGLPPGFLARLLWQESRFDPRAVSPMRAMGIAQFIASTARRRGLRDPFNPAAAIEASAAYLGEMTRRYGNLGLAAIGYNGGERRAEGWIARTGGLARETVDYVRIVTGRRAEAWREDLEAGIADPAGGTDLALDGDVPFQAACERMAAARRVTPLAVSMPSPWGVQMGFGATERAARASFDRLTRACRRTAAAARLEMVPLHRRGPGRPDYVAARLGASSRAEAVRLCVRLTKAGCACVVLRN